MEVLTQVLFTLIGLALLMLLVGQSSVAGYVLSGTTVVLIATAALVAGHRCGMTGVLERALLRLSRRFGWTSHRGIAGLDDDIRALYRAPGPPVRACFHHSISWLLAASRSAWRCTCWAIVWDSPREWPSKAWAKR